MQYVDVRAGELEEAQLTQREQFEQRRWPYPISLVDGEVVIVGSISVFPLAQAVERARQRGEHES